MAGGQKQFELLFQLKAALGGNFNGVFRNAIDTQKKLAQSIKQVNSVQGKIDAFTKTNSAIDKNKAKLSELQTEHQKLQQQLQQTAEKKKALEQAMETAKANGDVEEYERLSTELQATEKEYDSLNNKLKSNENQIQNTTAKIGEQEQKLSSLKAELQSAGVDTDNLGKSNEKLQKSYEKLKASQDRLQGLREKQQQITAEIGKTKMQLAGTVGTITAVAAAVYAGPVKSAMEYETALQKVSTIADSTEVPLSTMSSQIMQLSNTTGIAASTIAEDVYNAISAGQKTGDAVAFVSSSTKLAKAGFAESSQTLDVLTTILNAYGMEAEKVTSVSDMLIQTQNKGKVTVGELSSSMGKVIPTAKSYNVGLEQLCAGYAIMTSKGIACAESTTYMNSMLNELGKSGTTASEALKKSTGQSFQELMASGKSVGEVLQVLQDQATASGKSLADMFSSSEAGKAAVSLLSDGVEGFNNQVQGMIDSANATDEAFAKMEASTKAKMEKQKIENPVMNVIAHIVAYVMFIIYMLPIINVLVFSFTDGLTIKTGVIRKDSFTLENYKKLFRSATAYKPYLVSIVYSLLAALVVAVICIVVARIVTKAKHKYDKLFEPFILIPWLLPSTMIALGLMLTYDEPRMLLADKVLVATPIILLFAYIIIKIPFSYRMIRAGFVGLDGNMEEAAQVMGAKPLYTMRKVILPIIMPIVLSVIVLNFNGLLSEYDLSVFLYHPSYQPLGIVIKLATDETATIDAQAMAFVYTVVLMIISTIALWLGRYDGLGKIKSFFTKKKNGGKN